MQFQKLPTLNKRIYVLQSLSIYIFKRVFWVTLCYFLQNICKVKKWAVYNSTNRDFFQQNDHNVQKLLWIFLR